MTWNSARNLPRNRRQAPPRHNPVSCAESLPMRFSQLALQTLREAPANARSAGFAFLVRAGYLSRDKEVLFLGQQAIARMQALADQPNFYKQLSLPVLRGDGRVFFLHEKGGQEVIHCPSCRTASRRETAVFAKTAFSQEVPLPLETVHTPDCNTIEALAALLNIPKQKTAKALMFTRLSDGKFIFVVLRGDHTLSEEKLHAVVGGFRLASPEEIQAAGAAAGYASPINLADPLIVVDDLIPNSPNLVAGANQKDYHLLNTNCGRDYPPGIVADLTLAGPGDPCVVCGSALAKLAADILVTNGQVDFLQTLLAVAEMHHDDKGLKMPFPAAPFDVQLVALPGREMDTLAAAAELTDRLEQAGFSVLFDDRDERAGVKFNDADLLGCPLRLTVGERGLREGMVEFKRRTEADGRNIPLADAVDFLKIT